MNSDAKPMRFLYLFRLLSTFVHLEPEFFAVLRGRVLLAQPISSQYNSGSYWLKPSCSVLIRLFQE